MYFKTELIDLYVGMWVCLSHTFRNCLCFYWIWKVLHCSNIDLLSFTTGMSDHWNSVYWPFQTPSSLSL